MTSISIHEAKTHLSSLIADIERRGEHIIICRHGRAVAELIPIPHGSRLNVDPELAKIKINYDPTSSTEEEWNDA